MAWFLKTSDDRGTARNERLFREAMRSLTREMDAILSRNAATGCLKSGATIKALIQAMHSTTVDALNEALRGIGAVTEHSGRKRKGLLEQLRESLAAHQHTAEGTIQIAIERIGLGGDFEHALPLIEQSRRRQCEQIADFAERWNAPAGKPWKERHPFVYDGLLLLIGAVIGLVLQPLATSILPQVAVSRH